MAMGMDMGTHNHVKHINIHQRHMATMVGMIRIGLHLDLDQTNLVMAKEDRKDMVMVDMDHRLDLAMVKVGFSERKQQFL
jgi:hypothetical protein